MTFNPSQSETMTLSFKLLKPLHLQLSMHEQSITTVDSNKHLGGHISADSTWHNHINYVKNRAWSRIHIMRKHKFQLDREILEVMFLSFVEPLTEYANIFWLIALNTRRTSSIKFETRL